MSERFSTYFPCELSCSCSRGIAHLSPQICIGAQLIYAFC